jgi:hypothetical protein
MAGKPKDVGRDTVLTVRMPRELHQRLADAAGDRSVSEDIRRRLEASFAAEPLASKDPRLGDLLTAIEHAADGAARMYPADEAEAYSVLEVAIRLLLDALRPQNAPDLVHEIYIATTAQLMARVERLLGLALGALGDNGVAKLGSLPSIRIFDEEQKP